MEIIQNLCPTSRYAVKCPYERTPTRIVVHNTANDAPARNEIAYMLRNDEEVSFHFAVDDQEAVQGLPLERNAWASGDGRGKGNMEGIHIEVCYSKSGGARFAQAEQNAARLIARLLNQYGWGIEKVTKHQDYDGKYCPHRTLDLGWGRFLRMVEQARKEEEDMPFTYEEFKAYFARYEQERAKQPASDWARGHIAHALENGLLSGDETGFRPQSFVTRQELAAGLNQTLLMAGRTE